MKFPKLDLLLYFCNHMIAKVPSHTVRLAFYRYVMGYDVAKDSYIFMNAWFDANKNFRMGANSIINQNCRLDNRGMITIGMNVSISAETIILTADHDIHACNFAGRIRPVVIRDYVFIGTRAMILPGVIIEEGAVVAAGSVVTKNVPAFTIVAGVPAISIGTRNKHLDYTVNYGRLFF